MLNKNEILEKYPHLLESDIFEVMPHLNENEIRQDFEQIWTFLTLIHHEIDPHWNESYGLKLNRIDLAIEIRPLRSDKGQSGRYHRPYYIFNFSEASKEKFWEWYRKLCKVKKRRATKEEYVLPHCLYHSVFALDYQIPPYNSKNKPASTKLAVNTAHCTTILALDIDDVDHKTYLKYKKKFTKVGIYSNDIFTGHGYQLYFILKTPTTDLTVMEQFFHLCKDILKIKEADQKVVDCARILRLGGYNSKGVLEGDKHFGQGVIKTQIMATTEERYDIQDIFAKLGGEYKPNKRPLNCPRWSESEFYAIYEPETYPYWDEHKGYVSKETKDRLKKQSKSQNKKTNTGSVVKALSLSELHPKLNIDSFPEGVKAMLYGFKKHHADNTLFYLTLQLKDMGYSEEVVVETLLTIAEQRTYGYPWEDLEYVENKTRSVFHSNYKNSKKTDFLNLQKAYGSLSFEDEMIFKKADSIKIERNLFSAELNSNTTLIIKHSKGSFRLWLILLLTAHDFAMVYKKQRLFTFEEIQKLYGKTEKPTREAIKILMKLNWIDKKSDVSKQSNEKYVYFVNHFSIKRAENSENFTSIPKGSISNILKDVASKTINERALIVYFYLRFRLDQDTEMELSQQTIATVLGVDRTVINKALKQLCEAGIILTNDDPENPLPPYEKKIYYIVR